jgi:diguanylate cyclase (GGDEF)-like protein
MKKLGIKSRVMLLAIIPLIVTTLILTSYSITTSIRTLEDSLQDRGRVIATQLAPASEYGVVSGNLAILQPLIQQAMAHEPDIVSIQITDKQGQSLAISGQVGNAATPANAMREYPLQWDAGNQIVFTAPIIRSLVELEDFSQENNTDHTNSYLQQQVVGQVFITMSRVRIGMLKQQIITNNMLFASVALLLSGFFAWRLGKRITRPIVSLANAVISIGEGKMEHHFPEAFGGEIETLQKGFNQMASQLKVAHESMQERIEDATHQLRHQAQHDSLTGLVNRQEFEKRLDRALHTVKHQDAKHVFCYMDLDQFKVVNDTCGHGAGDELLRQISLMLSGRIRGQDTLARLGGDEFGLLLKNCDMPSAIKIAEQILEMIQDFRFVHRDMIFRIGVSIGMVEITGEFSNVGAITSSADASCYAAKDGGRNRIHIYQPEDVDLSKRHVEMEWVGRILLAMEEERFCLYCQPIISLKNTHEDVLGKPFFYEILMRQVDQDGRIIPPMAFIPAAERYNIMEKIDRWVIKKTFQTYRQYIDLRKNPEKFLFTINLSGVSLSDATLLEYICDLFEQYRVPPDCICFEITETSAIVNLANTIQLMEALKSLGCRFLLDDFGSGMSSFAYLKNLPVDFLKMDGNYVRDIVSNPIDFAMTQSIHSIAEAMKIKTIAEFVESQETMDLLIEMGVDYGQGFFIGNPVPLDSVLKSIKQLKLENFDD